MVIGITTFLRRYFHFTNFFFRCSVRRGSFHLKYVRGKGKEKRRIKNGGWVRMHRLWERRRMLMLMTRMTVIFLMWWLCYVAFTCSASPLHTTSFLPCLLTIAHFCCSWSFSVLCFPLIWERSKWAWKSGMTWARIFNTFERMLRQQILHAGRLSPFHPIILLHPLLFIYYYCSSNIIPYTIICADTLWE